MLLAGLAVVLPAWLLMVLPAAQRWQDDIDVDALLRLRGSRPAPGSVTVVAIDAGTLRALGLPSRAPEIPRRVHAEAIDALAAAGARVIAIDVSFARPGTDAEGDLLLREALRRAGRVVLLDLLERATGPDGAILDRQLLPQPAFLEHAAHAPFPLRRAERTNAWSPVTEVGGGGPTLPVVAARVGGWTAPRDLRSAFREDHCWLDLYGPPRTVPTIGLDQVIADAADGQAGRQRLAQAVGGRAVFVGYSGAHPGEQDRVRDEYATVFTGTDGLRQGGVEIAATAYANLLENRAPEPPAMAARLGITLAWGALLVAIARRLAGLPALLVIACVAGAYLGVAALRFAAGAAWMPILVPLLMQAPAGAALAAAWGHAREKRTNRRMRVFIDDLVPSHVVEAHLVRELRGDDVAFAFEGVFLATDIEGFTTICETLSPAAARERLNAYFAHVFPAVERQGGQVSQISGDAILAYWFEDPAGSDMRQCACRAATEIARMTAAAPAARADWALPTRIGIHAGTVTLARVGASRHHEFRAVGDAANTACRIEGLSKHLGTHLLASHPVLAGSTDWLWRPLGEFVLAGRTAALAVGEIVCPIEDAGPGMRRRCDDFGAALALYRAGRWAEAARCWDALLDDFPEDGPSRFYAALARRLAAAPPAAGWTPEVHMASK